VDWWIDGLMDYCPSSPPKSLRSLWLNSASFSKNGCAMVLRAKLR
jgi:hypothetical protein